MPGTPCLPPQNQRCCCCCFVSPALRRAASCSCKHRRRAGCSGAPERRDSLRPQLRNVMAFCPTFVLEVAPPSPGSCCGGRRYSRANLHQRAVVALHFRSPVRRGKSEGSKYAIQPSEFDTYSVAVGVTRLCHARARPRNLLGNSLAGCHRFTVPKGSAPQQGAGPSAGLTVVSFAA